MRLYLDSSALLKLCRNEAGSTDLALLVDGADTVVASVLTATEARRAAQRLDLPQSVVTAVLDRCHLVVPDADVYAVAGLLPGRHLRTLDALHIALALRTDCDAMASYDARQRDAARIAGLPVMPDSARS